MGKVKKCMGSKNKSRRSFLLLSLSNSHSKGELWLWWKVEEDLDVTKIGLECKEGYTTFASTNENCVIAFIEGAKAVINMLKNLQG